jgi:alpha-glucosidase
VDTVKTGYVGYGQGIKRRDESGNILGLEWHHGQFMVQHYQRVVETAAQYQIMINAHEPIKDTGLRRTFPNFLTREGARGQEYNAWDEEGGNPVDYATILPFTRLLAGPMDYTPGIFDILLEERPNNRINHTLAQELALYVVFYSPLQMAADLPENYEGQPAFQFIRNVPVDWQDTQVLHAQIGDFVTIVRQDRNSEDWYLGSVTDENGRTLETALTFLTAGQAYVAEIYADAADADWVSNPLALDMEQVLVDSNSVMNLYLAPGGGQAIRFRPATDEEMDSIAPYQS